MLTLNKECEEKCRELELLQEFKLLQSKRPKLYHDFNQGFQLLLKTECNHSEFQQLTSKLAEIFNAISVQMREIIPNLSNDAQMICNRIQNLEKEHLKITVKLYSLQFESAVGCVDYAVECAELQQDLEQTVDFLRDEQVELYELSAQMLGI